MFHSIQIWITDDGPQAQGELADPHAAGLGGQEVPQFVHEDDQAQGNGYLDNV
jgi:hypothetical protein